MVGGAGYVAGKSVARASSREAGQEERLESLEREQATTAAAPAQGAPAESKIDQLTKLGQLRDSGVLSEEEFEAEKQKILGS